MRTILVALCMMFIAVMTLADGAPEIDELRAFLAVPVDERLNEAISRDDLRPLGIWRFTLTVPGVPDTTQMNVPKDVLVIPGTSDAFISEEHGRLVHEALAYATDYNSRLRTRRGE